MISWTKGGVTVLGNICVLLCVVMISWTKGGVTVLGNALHVTVSCNDLLDQVWCYIPR